MGAAFTVQFTHQGTQFGVLALFQGPSLGWYFGNGYVDTQTGAFSNLTPADGQFQAGPPPVLSISFAKSHFPHGDAADDKLTAFKAVSADFKPLVPVILAEDVSGQDVPVDPDFIPCDTAEGALAYTFQTGEHTMHGAASGGNATMQEGGNLTTQGGSDATSPAAAPRPEGQNDSPGLAPVLVALAAAGVALIVRRRR